jgi:sphingomyelin phosphodiesterase
MRIHHVVAAAALLAATSAATLQPVTASADTAPVSPRVATYNVFMLSQLLPPPWNPMKRADLIANQNVLAGQDVVVLQEAFDNDASTKLLANLAPRYPYQTPVLGRSHAGWDSSSGPFLWEWSIEDGGVAILSRWPIRYRSQHVYHDGCGTDGFAAKGFAYARIDAPGTHDLHVIGTHNQSDDSLCSAGEPARVRASQHAEIADFLRHANIPAGDTVIIAGDLNVDRDTAEYPAMLRNLDVSAPEAFTGNRVSYDSTTNGIAAASGDPSQYLDYVLLANGHARPAGRWTNEARAVHSPAWQVTQYFQARTFTDYSDHYPVFAASS